MGKRKSKRVEKNWQLMTQLAATMNLINSVSNNLTSSTFAKIWDLKKTDWENQNYQLKSHHKEIITIMQMRAKKMIIMGWRKWEKLPNRVLNLFYCVSIGKVIIFARFYLRMGGKFIWEKKMLKKYALKSFLNTMRRLKEIIYDRLS